MIATAGASNKTEVQIPGDVRDESPGAGVCLISCLDNDHVIVPDMRESDAGHIEGGVVQGGVRDKHSARPGLLPLDHHKVSSCPLGRGQAWKGNYYHILTSIQFHLTPVTRLLLEQPESI